MLACIPMALSGGLAGCQDILDRWGNPGETDNGTPTYGYGGTQTQTSTPTQTSTQTQTSTSDPTDEYGQQTYGEYGYGGVAP